jgi:hypothetical protein
MKIWEIKYLLHIYQLIKINENIINWEMLSKNTTIPLIIINKFINKINFYDLSRHPKIDDSFINNYPNKNWDWDLIHTIKNNIITNDMLSILDYNYYFDKLNKIDYDYITDISYNNIEIIDFFQEKKKFKLEYYVKLIQKLWRNILMNPHNKIGKKYLLNQFTKIRIETSF